MKTNYKGKTIKVHMSEVTYLYYFSVNGVISVAQDFCEPDLALEEAKELIDLGYFDNIQWNEIEIGE